MGNNNLLVTIEDIINHAKTKTVYEVQSRINTELAKIRKANFDKESVIMGEITKDLNLTKLKLDLLKESTKYIPQECRVIIMPLINELEKHIKVLRKKRQTYNIPQKLDGGK